MEKDNFLPWALVILLTIILITILAVTIKFKYTNDDLNNKLNYEYIREGYIIRVEECDLWVIDEVTGRIIEVDIYDEYVHEEICVGDIALYIVNYDYTDADLLGYRSVSN